jgi:hypothetical protein
MTILTPTKKINREIFKFQIVLSLIQSVYIREREETDLKLGKEIDRLSRNKSLDLKKRSKGLFPELDNIANLSIIIKNIVNDF